MPAISPIIFASTKKYKIGGKIDWQDQLISLYLQMCKFYSQGLSGYCTRTSHYSNLRFSDEEALTLFLSWANSCTRNNLDRYAATGSSKSP